MDDSDLALLREDLMRYREQGRTMLLPALHKAQELYGYIPESAAVEISKYLKVPLAEIYGVIGFYSHFHGKPVGKSVIQICNDPVCAMAGADGYFKLIRSKLDKSKGRADVVVERAPCLGLCDIAPSILVQGEQVHPGRGWRDMAATTSRKHQSRIVSEVDTLTMNCGKGKTTSLSEYLASGGYAGFQRALRMTPQEVIEEIKASGLVGRGGAAFPTGVKWESAARAVGYPKYLVCNADEAEPGTFKDRIMMEDDPHRVLEGILIAAYAIGANYGYMYIRGEYREPYTIMKNAVEEAMTASIIGANLFASGFHFELELRMGAGAYVCGEETALFESIEGKRGLPRVKPPFPTSHGLFGKPTVINNVETLANVPTILKIGSGEYRKIGTEKSPGSKLFCVSGDVERPGLYEVPFGVSIRHLLIDLAGGVRGGKQFQTALFGGAAGAFARENELDVCLTFEDLRAAGIPLGAGVITVFDETRNLRAVLFRLSQFFAEESCGKCYPCQLGTQRQKEILERLVAGKLMEGDLDRLEEVGNTMADASICGLGQTASMAITSAMRKLPEVFLSDYINLSPKEVPHAH